MAAVCSLAAQEQAVFRDTHYLEDQLYLTVAYNALTSKPEGFFQQGFSGTISGGFIKDIPLNTTRNLALGIGLGYAYDNYAHNLRVSETTSPAFSLASAGYDVNRLRTHRVVFPIEIRFRDSTPERYKFWRCYAGLQFSYVFRSKATFSGGGESETVPQLSSLDNYPYGLILSAGYAHWNLHIYYGLNPVFKNALLAGSSLHMTDLKIGLRFYIL
ncbi:MAG: porin family protein [Lutibacter sp.]|nr:porin family protein [Lutibacter sp.]